MTVKSAPGVPLTPRERQVGELVAEGLSSRQIARRLYVSERTVHAHLRSIYTKTGTGGPGTRRVRLVVWLQNEHAANLKLALCSTGLSLRSAVQEISVEEARKVLGDLVTGVANGGEPPVITKNGVRAARIVAATPPDLVRQRYDAAPRTRLVMSDGDEYRIRREGQTITVAFHGDEFAIVAGAGGEAAARIDLTWGPKAPNRESLQQRAQ